MSSIPGTSTRPTETIKSPGRNATRLLDSLPTRVSYSEEDEGELTRTLMGHDSHFLQRTARFRGAELDRAMRLYHHSAVVKRLVADAIQDDPLQDRCAVALSDAPPSGHVILSRGGFITCLTAGMRIGGLRVLPFRPFAEAMDAADSQIELATLHRRQLSLLDPQELIAALVRGPGHVTREMAEVVALAPNTYVVPVHFAFQFAANNYARIVDTMFQVDGLRRSRVKDAKFQSIRRSLLRHQEKAVATCRLCLYLLGTMDEPLVTELLGVLAPHYTDFSNEALSALARHRNGYHRLYQVVGDQQADLNVRQTCLDMLLQHIAMYPSNLQPFLQDLVEKDAGKTPDIEKLRPFLDQMYGASPEQLAQWQEECRAELPQLPQPLDVITWPHSYELLRHVNVLGHPISLLFPPADLKQQAEESFRQHLRTPPEREEPPPPAPVVRTEPRVGRNDPCPCGSGRKHKRCCGAQA